MADETAWLIERADGDKEGPRYLVGIRQGYGACWSTDHDMAIRFFRAIDAKRISDGLEAPAKIVEHMWCEPSRDIMDGRGRRDITRNPRSS